MAASVVIHGAVLLLDNGSEPPESAGSEAVVEISLVAANKPQPFHEQHPVPVQETNEIAPEASTDRREKAGEKAVQLQTEAAATNSLQQQAEISGRESLVRNHLERFKYYPASARRRGISGEVEVAFELDRSGQARVLKILSGSGYSLLDEAAILTVHRAEPFPAGGGAYQFILRFRAS